MRNIKIILVLVPILFSSTFAYSADLKKLWKDEGGTVTKQSPDEKSNINNPSSSQSEKPDKYESTGVLFPIWADYQQIFSQGFKVCQNERATITFNLPESYISKNDKIILSIDLESGVYTVTDGLKQKNFELITPHLSINDGSIFGRYRIPVITWQNRQTCKVEIRSERLKAGPNKLEFAASPNGYVRWRGSGCKGFFVHKMYFNNIPQAEQ